MLIVAAQLENLRTRKDRTLSLTFGTQELDPAKAGELMTLNQSLCYLAIKPEYFSAEEEEAIDSLHADLSDAGKTPSQRLRSVLFVNWQNDGQGFTTFAAYYAHNMERIIEHYKAKLD
jgi:hypothetical protein